MHERSIPDTQQLDEKEATVMSRPSLVELHKSYCESFPFGLRQGSSPTEWAKGVKAFWIDQVRNKQYRQHETMARGNIRGETNQPRHPYHAPNEFMIDVVWEDMAADHRCLRLVMEYEYDRDPDEQELDFRKLLHVKAYGKVFIFEVNKRADPGLLSSKIGHFCGLIKGCVTTQQPPDEYLLICHRDGPGTHTTISGFLVPYDGGSCQELPEHRRDVPP